MFCTHCGHQIPDGHRFCEMCGKAVQQSAQKPSSIQPPVPAVSAPVPPVIPQPMPAVTPADAVPTAPLKKKKKKIILPLISILVLAIIASAAAFLLFGKKTVYLVTKYETDSMGLSTTYRYEYDEKGRIVKYKFDQSSQYTTSVSENYEIAYTYDKDGKLTTAKFESNGETVVVKYVYEGNKLIGLKSKDLTENLEGSKLDVSCDEEGKLKHISLEDEEGNEYFTWDFKYHDNGIIKKSTYSSKYPISRKTIMVYNEEGKNTESSIYMNDELTSRTVYDYDKHGNMSLMETYGSDNKLETRMKYDYTYSKDQLVGMSWSILFEHNGQEDGVEMVFDCEWDNLECTLTIDEINGNKDLLDSLGEKANEITIVFEVDKAGNVLNAKMKVGEIPAISLTNKYEAFKVPLNYKETNFRNDPRFLTFLTNL